ncbi:unnamed protein product [Allacma fusca]|uniref:CENP-V/GFA domain-containing protein n=1 Tax=Allacma fusca TaxID=39272 RepID=A0A8J2NW58_9HEXA|nr:unnamed protein product [Allacma fusca]
MAEMTRYQGSCHCGSVKFEVYAPKHLKVIDCNCSICVKKQNRHFIVPSTDFKLVAGHTTLTTYTFNTHQARHMFCSKCGVQCFYIPRSNPDGYGIMPHCLDSPQPSKVSVEKFNGEKWEEAMAKASLRDRSNSHETCIESSVLVKVTGFWMRKFKKALEIKSTSLFCVCKRNELLKCTYVPVCKVQVNIVLMITDAQFFAEVGPKAKSCRVVSYIRSSPGSV